MDEIYLKQILERQEETLALVQKLWKAEKWRRFWAIVKYMIIAIIVVGGVYFVQPYFGKISLIFQNIFNLQRIIQDPGELQKFLQQLQN